MTPLVHELCNGEMIDCDLTLELILDLGGDCVGETAKAAVPRTDVEAGADLGQYVLKGVGNSLEVALLESNLGAILLSQIVDLFLEDEGLVQQVDDDVEALSDSDDESAEFWRGFVFDVHLLQDFSGKGVLLSQFVEDGRHDLDLSVSVGGVPNLMPHVRHLFLVLQ